MPTAARTSMSKPTATQFGLTIHAYLEERLFLVHSEACHLARGSHLHSQNRISSPATTTNSHIVRETNYSRTIPS